MFCLTVCRIARESGAGLSNAVQQLKREPRRCFDVAMTSTKEEWWGPKRHSEIKSCDSWTEGTLKPGLDQPLPNKSEVAHHVAIDSVVEVSRDTAQENDETKTNQNKQISGESTPSPASERNTKQERNPNRLTARTWHTCLTHQSADRQIPQQRGEGRREKNPNPRLPAATSHRNPTQSSQGKAGATQPGLDRQSSQ